MDGGWGSDTLNDVSTGKTQAGISIQHKNIHFTLLSSLCYNLTVSLFSVLSVLKKTEQRHLCYSRFVNCNDTNSLITYQALRLTTCRVFTGSYVLHCQQLAPYLVRQFQMSCS